MFSVAAKTYGHQEILTSMTAKKKMADGICASKHKTRTAYQREGVVKLEEPELFLPVFPSSSVSGDKQQFEALLQDYENDVKVAQANHQKEMFDYFQRTVKL